MRGVIAIMAAGLALYGLAGCSKPPAADLLKQVQEKEELTRRSLDTMRVKPDVKAAFAPILDEYSRLVEKYEEAPESEIALFRRAVIRGNDLKEYEGAARDYTLYAERYPSGAKTPLVMFLIGYIYNNELHNLDSAGAAYRRFLEKYPDHEMATSARFELENLGKSPDELILKDPPAEKPEARPAGKPTAKGKKPKQI